MSGRGDVWRRLWLALGLVAMASPAAADMPAGLVKKLTGSVRIERGGAAVAAQVGTPVMAEDRIVTGADSSVGITLKDDMRLAAGPNSVIALDRFAFNATTNEGSLSLRIWKGTLRAITGLIGRQSPRSLDLKTRTATIGLRGTDFIVEVPAND